MNRRHSNILKIKIKRTARALNSAKIKLASFLQSNSVHPDSSFQLIVAFYEIIANILEHAGPSYKNHDIECSCRIEGNDAMIIIRYRGDEFDFTRAPMPDIQAHFASGKNGGLGIYMIRTLIDDVGYAHRNGMNELTMIKRTAPGD